MATAPPGVGTGLDVNSIVGQLMALERRPLVAFARQEGMVQAQISAWGSLKGSLASLQAAVQELARPERFQRFTAGTGDAAIATAAAGAGAVPGRYSLEVLALAQQHKLHSGAFASAAAVVGSGTLTFQFGTYDAVDNLFTVNGAKAAQTVTIAPGQNSLAGIRDAVNAAGIGVAASLVNDGSGERLVFSGKDSGAANSLRISVLDDDGEHTDAEGLSQLAYDPTAPAGNGRNLAQALAAQDASLRIDGIAVTRAGNVVVDAIQGVTITLAKAAPGTVTTVNVSRDTGATKTAIQRLVDAYNATAKAFAGQMSYHAETRQAGLLQGDSVGMAVVSRLRGVLSGAVEGLAGPLRTLSQLGVSFQTDGTLALDADRLQTAMDDAFDDIAGVFTRALRSTHASVGYRGATEATRPGTYAVQVTQAATRGTLVGAQAAALEISAGVNDAVSITVDGTAASVTLAAGTYASASALAAELQSKLNGASALSSAGIQVAVTESGGVLTLASVRYGSASTVALGGGTGATGLFGDDPLVSAGQDVAGTIDGVAASGAGRTLTGATGSAAEGLQIDIAPGATGSLGAVSYSIGHAARLERAISGLLAAEGAIDLRTSGLDARVKALAERQARLNERLVAVERRYRAQFVALDAMLARMNATSSYLASQLANLPKIEP